MKNIKSRIKNILLEKKRDVENTILFVMLRKIHILFDYLIIN